MIKYLCTKNKYNLDRKEYKMKIEKNTKISEIVEKAPEKVQILISAGMGCLGCPAAQVETLEEACMVHGIDVEELLEILNKEEK